MSLRRIKDSEIPWAAMFAPAPGEYTLEDLEIDLDGLFRHDILYLQRHPELPLLYTFPYRWLRYIPEENPGDIEKQWWVPYWILRQGGADCKALAAWRAAELVVRFGDANARPVGRLVEVTKYVKRFHAYVEHGDGTTEDPSERMGMLRKA